MKKLVIVLVSFFTLLIAAALIAPSFIDWNSYKSEIQKQVMRLTGYELEIKGNIDLAVLPSPHLNIEDFTLKNPVAGADAQIMTMDRASVHVGLAPLLQKNIQVRRVDLLKPIITIVKNENGQLNILTDQLSAEKDTSAKAGPKISLDAITIKNGQFQYNDKAQGQVQQIKDVNLSLSAVDLLGPYFAEGGFVYNDQYIKFDLESGDLKTNGEAFALQLKTEIPGLHLGISYQGVVSLGDTPDAQGQFDFNVKSLGDILRYAGQTPPSNEAFAKKIAISGLLSANPSVFELQNSQLIFGDVKFDGNLKASVPAQPAPISLVLGYVSDDTLDLSFLSQLSAAQTTDKKNAQTGKEFLPSIITLPRDFDVDAKLNIAAVKYGNSKFNDAAIILLKDKNKTDFDIAIEGEAQNKLLLNTELSFGSRSVSPKSGQISYADPVLKINTDIHLDDPVKFMKGFGANYPAGIEKTFIEPLNASIRNASVRPDNIDFGDVQFSVLQNTYALSGSFMHEARPVLTIKLRGDRLNVDKIFGTPTAAQKVQQSKTAPAAIEDTIRQSVQALNMPLNIDFEMALSELIYQKYDLRDFALSGALSNNKAQIRNIAFSDMQGNDIRISANIGDIKELQNVGLEVNATLLDANKTIAYYLPQDSNVKIPFTAGRTQIGLKIDGDLDLMAVDASLRAQNLNANITGNVQNILDDFAIDQLRFKADHPNYSDLVKLFAPAFRGYSQAQAVSVTADIDKNAENFTLQNVKAAIGQSDIQGSVSYNEGKIRPYIVVDLSSDKLVLDRLLPQSTVGASKEKSAAKSPDQEFIWSRNAIDTSALFAIDANIKASVKTLLHERLNARKVDIAAALQNGALDIQKINADAFGGALALTGKLSAADKDRSPLSLNSSVDVSNVDLEQIVYAFTGSRILKAKGRVSGKTSLTSTGLSVAALVFDLGGKGSLQGQEITIIGMDLNKLARALTSMSSSWSSNISGLMDATISGGQTYFETLDGNFTIAEGIVTIPKMLFTGDQFGMNFTGTVDLPRWMIDAAARIDVLEGQEQLSFSVPVQGSLSNPVKTVPQKLLSKIISERIGQDLINPLINDLLGNKLPARQTGGDATDGTTDGTGQEQQRNEIRPEDAIRGVIEGLF